MTLPGLVAARNLADVADRERAWDNLGLNISANVLINGLDNDAANYLINVIIADGSSLEPAVQAAVNNFVVGCKTDGIWPAIKASCILAGARTLNGALVPLVGTAPTNFNFVSGDYNRKTGLVGDGSTKYLNSNRNNNADPQDSQHVSVYITANATGTSGSRRYISARGATATGASLLGRTVNASEFYSRFDNSGFLANALFNVPSFSGLTRDSSASFVFRLNGASTTRIINSAMPANANIHLYRNASADSYADARLAFYSIGESLDLALLDARVTTLINAIGAAIP
jgi:hypothetical protein